MEGRRIVVQVSSLGCRQYCSEYDSFVTSINTRVDPVLSEELIGLMLSQEIYRGRAITSPDSITLISPSPAVHTVSRTPSYHSAPYFFRGRGCG